MGKEFVHVCVLDCKSQSGLPSLAPQSAKIYQWYRQFKKWFLVSESHYLTHKLFRSSSMLMNEKRRQIKSGCWFIIHPFSKLHIIIEVIMTVVWAIVFTFEIYLIGFNNSMERITLYFTNYMFLFDIFQFFYIMISFILGYVEVTTNEVILNLRKIAITYSSTYFLFDLLGIVNISWMISKMVPMINARTVHIIFSVIKAGRIVRITTMLQYSRQITNFLRVSDTHHKIACLIVKYAFLLHWCACFLYLLPRLDLSYYKLLAEDSWVSHAILMPKSTWNKYLICLHTAMCYFLSAGTGMYKIYELKDQIACSFITNLGFIYIVYMTAVVLQMVSSTSASESKYEELVHNLHEYAIRKKMPHMMRLRLLLYYENRFQKRYFRESAILSTLSEHLRYEILLHSCKHLFEKLTIFHGLSKVVLGTIIACLKQEVYLPNDVITKADVPAESMYLIGYGALALYTIDGLEIMHLQDGDHFGETSLLRPDTDKLLSVVAIETTELYKLEKVDFFRIMHRYDDFSTRMNKAVAEELNVVSKLQDHLTRIHGKHDFINDLRHGKILEQSYKRKFTDNK